MLRWKDENSWIYIASANHYLSDALYFHIETVSFTIINTIMKNRIRILLTVHATQVYSSRLHIKWVPVRHIARHIARYYRALIYYKAQPVFYSTIIYCTYTGICWPSSQRENWIGFFVTCARPSESLTSNKSSGQRSQANQIGDVPSTCHT